MVAIGTAIAHVPLHLLGVIKLDELDWIAAGGAALYGLVAVVAGFLAKRWKYRRVVLTLSVIVHVSGLVVYLVPTIPTLPLAFLSLLGLLGIPLFADREVKRIFAAHADHESDDKALPNGYHKQTKLGTTLALIGNILFPLALLGAIAAAILLRKV